MCDRRHFIVLANEKKNNNNWIGLSQQRKKPCENDFHKQIFFFHSHNPFSTNKYDKVLIRIVCVRLDHGHFSCRTNISVVFIHCRTQIQINYFHLVMCLFCFCFSLSFPLLCVFILQFVCLFIKIIYRSSVTPSMHKIIKQMFQYYFA